MGNERRENVPTRTATEFPGKVEIRKISSRKREITPDPEKKAGNLTTDERTPSRAKPMLDHPETHTAEKPLSCSQCDARFSLKAHLVSHEKTHNKPFSCSYCKARFLNSRALKRHERRHTGEKPFSCAVCSAAFIRKDHLVEHRRVHTGEKPFSCSVCGARFARKPNLQRHEKTHAPKTSHSCSHCEHLDHV
ncbi:unnamed protein product [Cyprideis torosa]|uniref:Uncharacterized protein n=1 Tax=Cyprideis torosa TaxID=163714 RepID=A0A7R8WUM9_9CRUS|nr:unnamed protein product [Cyprideis torosa]CAG0906583.1 unnamed protein product [Cyprideis torosa]